MTPRLRISIRSKILLVLSVVVFCALALYLYLASRIFYEDKTLLIYELNQTNVRTLGGEVETDLNSVLDQLRLWAQHGDPQLETNSDWVRVALLERNPVTGAIETKPLRTWNQSLSAFGKDDSFLDRTRARFPVPFEKVLKSGTWVRNVTLPPQSESDEIIPMMTLAMAVKRAPPLSDAVIYADVKLDRIVHIFSNPGIAVTYLVDSEGYPLAMADQNRLVQAQTMSADPLIHAALRSKVRSEVRKFDQDQSSYLGSFYRLSIPGVTVASKVELQEAYSAATILIRKSLLYALLVITAALLIALIFSYSLTVPIERMVEATRQIAQGNFNLTVPISSRDELALLATSFNTMTRDLKLSREQLEEYSRNLEKKVTERTLAMREAQDALLRTTRLASVGEVAGRAAHEVLNPLTNIMTRLEKIRNQESSQDEKDLELLGEIVTAWNNELSSSGGDPEGLLKALSAPSSTLPGKSLLQEDLENLSAIGRDLTTRQKSRRADLDFLLKESDRISKIVNGMRQLTRVTSSRKKLSAHGIIDETVAAMSDLFQKNEVQIEKAYCEGDPRILADHDELLQVFSNLFRNSLQAIQQARRNSTPFGIPPKLWITTQLSNTERGSVLKIRICDNGPGVSEENAQKIFEPTFTTKSADEGTGIGLAICRRFIRALDGEITLEKSMAAVETVMLIELPAEPSPADRTVSGEV